MVGAYSVPLGFRYPSRRLRQDSPALPCCGGQIGLRILGQAVPPRSGKRPLGPGHVSNHASPFRQHKRHSVKPMSKPATQPFRLSNAARRTSSSLRDTFRRTAPRFPLRVAINQRDAFPSRSEAVSGRICLRENGYALPHEEPWARHARRAWLSVLHPSRSISTDERIRQPF